MTINSTEIGDTGHITEEPKETVNVKEKEGDSSCISGIWKSDYFHIMNEIWSGNIVVAAEQSSSANSNQNNNNQAQSRLRQDSASYGSTSTAVNQVLTPDSVGISMTRSTSASPRNSRRRSPHGRSRSKSPAHVRRSSKSRKSSRDRSRLLQDRNGSSHANGHENPAFSGKK
ncbi:unnamed protein product [Clavelina lepadiformis]|uniref:Uncharacterized protein n=1 Tax=Clavelina lepadiformis TaxID=159417 RepID=A0ABP0F533_CLALP